MKSDASKFLKPSPIGGTACPFALPKLMGKQSKDILSLNLATNQDGVPLASPQIDRRLSVSDLMRLLSKLCAALTVAPWANSTCPSSPL